MKKRIILIFLLIISYIIISLIFSNEVLATNQTVSTDINSIDSNIYPQIKDTLQKLKEEHPNWNFKILYTDIEWSEVIANEYVGHGGSPRNLVPANNSNYGGEWICKACGKDKTYDSGNWNCASEAAIAYMMDPRNSINNSDIFQFMELTYTECNIDTIKTMVANTFLNNESYINAIMESAKNNNINAYYLVARMLQEQGSDGSVLCSGQGYNGQYIGYYNIFNIGASGNGKEAVILNGLKRAESYGWTTLESSIDGGAAIIAKSYIARGQNTLYFQKFDVENSDGDLYWHQYMQNILAAQSEGTTLRKTFENIGSIEGEYTFIIPLYNNMPQTACSRPSTTSTEEPTVNIDLVKVNVNKSLYLRSEPKKTANTVGSIYKDEIVTRLVQATEKVDGTYWDYVMKADGTKGYAARQTYDGETYKLYLVPIETPKPEEPEQPEETENEDSNTTTEIKNDKLKIDTTTNQTVTVPGATVQDFVSLVGKEVVVKNAKGEILPADSKLGTGCIIDDTYVVCVLGDIDGDGDVLATDALQILKNSTNLFELKDAYLKAADIDGDGTVLAIDALKALKYSTNSEKIEIN